MNIMVKFIDYDMRGRYFDINELHVSCFHESQKNGEAQAQNKSSKHSIPFRKILKINQ